MHELYISYKQETSNAKTANVKCIVTWLYVAKKEKISLRPLFKDGVQLPQG